MPGDIVAEPLHFRGCNATNSDLPINVFRQEAGNNLVAVCPNFFLNMKSDFEGNKKNNQRRQEEEQAALF